MVLSAIGLILGIALLIFLCWKGFNSLIAALISSVVVIATSGIHIWEGLVTGASNTYGAGIMSFVGPNVVMFFLGALLGELMDKSGYAMSIAYTIIKWLGAKRAIFALFVVTGILTYGGVSMFVVIFTVYPIGLYLCKEANLPKYLIPAAVCAGGATISMTAIPGTPALGNVLPTSVLGTTTLAAPILGIIAAVILFVLCTLWLAFAEKRARAKGLAFDPSPSEATIATTDSTGNVPNFVMSIIPIILVAVINIGGAALGFNSTMCVCLGLLAGSVFTAITAYKRIPNLLESLNKGASGGLSSLLNTAAVVGFASVVKAAPAFAAVLNFVAELPFPPLVSATVSTAAICGVTTSASGGIQVWLNLLGEQYLASGVNLDILHRCIVIAGGTLDSLPHAGPIVGMMAITNVKMKDAYPHIGMCCTVIPILVTIICVILGSLGVC